MRIEGLTAAACLVLALGGSAWAQGPGTGTSGLSSGGSTTGGLGDGPSAGTPATTGGAGSRTNSLSGDPSVGSGAGAGRTNQPSGLGSSQPVTPPRGR